MKGRHLVTGVTLLVLLGVVAAMGLYGYHTLTAPVPGLGAASPTCTASTGTTTTTLTRHDIQVSVFNAGGRAGLASATLDKLTQAGFVAGNVGNAPQGAVVRRAAVWTTKNNDSAAQLVAQAMGAGTQVEVTQQDLGPGVDVLVGPRFGGLDPSAPRQVKLDKPVSTCGPAS